MSDGHFSNMFTKSASNSEIDLTKKKEVKRITFLIASIAAILYIGIGIINFGISLAGIEIPYNEVITITSQISILFILIGFMKIGEKYNKQGLRLLSILGIALFLIIFLTSWSLLPMAQNLFEEAEAVEKNYEPPMSITTMGNRTWETPHIQDPHTRETIIQQRKAKILSPLTTIAITALIIVLIYLFFFGISILGLKEEIQLASKVGKMILYIVFSPILLFIPIVNLIAIFIIPILLVVLWGEIATLFLWEYSK